MGGKSVYKWTAIDRIANSVMTFGGNIFLARLLDPDDFGLLGMVAIFTAFAYNISSCGMSDGLIKKKDPSPVDYSTVFVFNAACGLIFAVIFISTSGVVARFFGHEQLRGIMIAIAVCFFLQSLVMVQETRMRKNLEFKAMAVVRLSSTACALALAVVLALNGYGYWALVSMQVFLMAFNGLFYLLLSKWFPRIAFSRKSFREMFGYGVHLMVAYICYQTARNVNMSVLGKFSSASASGIYNQAHKLQEVPYALSESIFNWPFFAVLASTESGEDRRRVASRMHTVYMFINSVLTAYLFCISSYAFTALYGAKWDAAVPVFDILLVFGLLTAMKFFYQSVFKVHSRTKLIRNLTIVEVVMQLGLLAVFYKSSVTMIAWTQVIPVAAVMGVYSLVYIRLNGVSFRKYLSELLTPLAIPLVALGLTVAASFSWAPVVNQFVALIAVSAIYAAVLLSLCLIFKPWYFIEVKTRILNKKQS